MKEAFKKAIADGLNELGYGVDVPNDEGEMKFGPNCHEVETIFSNINTLIKAAPIVYGNPRTQLWNDVDHDDTHRARLMFIEEIAKEKCVEHLPTFVDAKNNMCRKCGATIVSVWKAKDE